MLVAILAPRRKRTLSLISEMSGSFHFYNSKKCFFRFWTMIWIVLPLCQSIKNPTITMNRYGVNTNDQAGATVPFSARITLEINISISIIMLKVKTCLKL